MRFLVTIAILPLLFGCAEQGAEPGATHARAKPLVVTSNYPLYFFASEIAGDAVEVQLPDIAGDPAMWAPSGDDVATLQGADLVIVNGAGYESWLTFTTLPDGLLLDTTATVSDRLLTVEQATVHQHGPEGEHSHQGTAFTTWLDPQLAIEQARAIKIGLGDLLPQQAESFEVNFEGLVGRLEELDGQFRQAFEALGDKPVIFSHPVYQYLQDRYGINGRSLHWEPDVAPGTRDWIDLANLLRAHPARVMIWEGDPLPEVRQQLLEQGISSIVFEPAGDRPDTGDYASIMARNVESLNAADALKN